MGKSQGLINPKREQEGQGRKEHSSQSKEQVQRPVPSGPYSLHLKDGRMHCGPYSLHLKDVRMHCGQCTLHLKDVMMHTKAHRRSGEMVQKVLAI